MSSKFRALLLFLAVTTVGAIAAPPIKVACVGDSITQGARASIGKSYPEQLQSLLGQDSIVKNFGLGGTTMLRNGNKPYWNCRQFREAQAFQPDIVVLMFGANDSKPDNWAHAAEFSSDYRDMVKVFTSLPSSPKVFVCHVPTIAGPNKYKISETNSVAIRQDIDVLAKEMGLTVIPMDKAYGGNLSVLGTDNVHPDEQGCGELAAMVASVLKPLINPTSAATTSQ